MMTLLKLTLTLIVSLILLTILFWKIFRETIRWRQRKPHIRSFVEEQTGQSILGESFAIALPESAELRQSGMAWFAFTQDYAACCIKEQVAWDDTAGGVFLCRKSDIALRALDSSDGLRRVEFRACPLGEPNAVHALSLAFTDKRCREFAAQVGKRFV